MKRAILAIGVFLATVSSLFIGQTVGAVASAKDTFINSDNTFYAFVQSNERVNVTFTEVGLKVPSLKQKTAKVTVAAPGGLIKVCTIGADAPADSGCGFSQLSANQPGVWRFKFELPEDAEKSALFPKLKVGSNLYLWDLTIYDSTGVKAGRVWSNQYYIYQPPEIGFATDMTLYYQSQDGYLYRASYKDYVGELSNLGADSYGVVEDEKCEPAYKSTDASAGGFAPTYGKCGGEYKLFFEPPSDDLPVSATKWDGSLDWVRPQVKPPVVSDIKFAPDDEANVQSGTISFKLKDFIGDVEVKVDVNDDGNFDGASDVVIPAKVKFNDTGAQPVKFDGLDKDGNPILRSQPIGIKVEITKSAEIHLVATNVTGLDGGLILTRLSGENAPSSNVCWNDSFLGDESKTPEDIVVDGTACPDSLVGVHRWAYDTAWGKNRYIDNWAYSTAKVTGVSEIRYVNEKVAAQEAAVKRNIGIGVAALVLLVLGIGGGLYFWKKRSNKDDSNNLFPPTQVPPNSQPPTPPSNFMNQ